MKIILSSLALAAMAMPAVAAADIEKIVVPCEETLCFFSWPKLPDVEGWHQDLEFSYHYSINAQAPERKSFSDARAVIYARAIPKSDEPEIENLAALIQRDRAEFLERKRGGTISQATPLLTADGRTLPSLVFAPKWWSDWEQIAYGEEGEYYLQFVLSGQSKRSFEDALPAFRQFVNGYGAEPTVSAPVH